MNDRHDPWTGGAREDPYGLDGFDGLERLDGDAGAWSKPAPESGAPSPPAPSSC